MQTTYAIERVEVPSQAVVSIRDRVAPAKLPDLIGSAFADLYSRLALLGVHANGEPFLIYHRVSDTSIDAEVCVPVGEPVSASGRVVSRTLPACSVAMTLHVGPYDALGAAYSAVTSWIGERGLAIAGPFRERYLNAPDEVSSPAEYRTEIQVPVVEAAVPVGT
jgi:effector-binding domain-containing protein